MHGVPNGNSPPFVQKLGRGPYDPDHGQERLQAQMGLDPHGPRRRVEFP